MLAPLFLNGRTYLPTDEIAGYAPATVRVRHECVIETARAISIYVKWKLHLRVVAS